MRPSTVALANALRVAVLVLTVWIAGSSRAASAQSIALVADLQPGIGGSAPTAFFNAGTHAYFAARGPSIGVEPYATDGTPAGTFLVKDIARGTSDSSPRGFTLLHDGRVLFTAEDRFLGREPWVTDGTAAGTRILVDINAGPNGSDPNGFVTRRGAQQPRGDARRTRTALQRRAAGPAAEM